MPGYVGHESEPVPVLEGAEVLVGVAVEGVDCCAGGAGGAGGFDGALAAAGEGATAGVWAAGTVDACSGLGAAGEGAFAGPCAAAGGGVSPGFAVTVAVVTTRTSSQTTSRFSRAGAASAAPLRATRRRPVRESRGILNRQAVTCGLRQLVFGIAVLEPDAVLVLVKERWWSEEYASRNERRAWYRERKEAIRIVLVVETV
jgi:hypothetical protein